MNMKRFLGILLVVGLVGSFFLSTHSFLVKDTFAKNSIIVMIADSGPTPPDGAFAPPPPVTLPPKDPANGVNYLDNVPAFDWCYGCSATSAAMMMGYYDNVGYDDMYTGPTNNGVCPLDNSVWGPGECPLSATHKGIDGRTVRGHVDDYWVAYRSTEPDPYITNGWKEHIHADCTADFMWTNQYKNNHITDGGTYFPSFFDGATVFSFSSLGDPAYDPISWEPEMRDGCHGMRLFVESRGYKVLENFNQLIANSIFGNTKGFTYEDFKKEIDAGRPVLIQVTGHTMIGFGYNSSGGQQKIYIHDTWDHSHHEMDWGGTYAGLIHYGVTVMRLAPPDERISTVLDTKNGYYFVVDPEDEIWKVFNSNTAYDTSYNNFNRFRENNTTYSGVYSDKVYKVVSDFASGRYHIIFYDRREGISLKLAGRG